VHFFNFLNGAPVTDLFKIRTTCHLFVF